MLAAQTVPMPKIEYGKLDPEKRRQNGKALIQLLERIKADPVLRPIFEAKLQEIRNAEG